jgi:hypothetical protein
LRSDHYVEMSQVTPALRTERIKNRCLINARVEFQLLPLLREILRKSAGSYCEKRLEINRLRNPY